MRSTLGYKLALLLAVIGIGVAVFGFVQMNSKIKGMPRFVMPGTTTIQLPAGETTLWVEARSVVDGTAYEASASFDYRCGIEPSDGATLRAASSSVSYEIGNYQGRNAFDLEVATAGSYKLMCESSGDSQFVIAQGSGIGTSIVLGVLGLFVAMAAAVLALVTFVRRRGSRS